MDNILNIPEIFYYRDICGESERVIELAKAFRYLGIHSPEKRKQIVLQKMTFKYGSINVIYGQSGSGKSSLLRKIKEQLGGVDIADIPEEDDFIINLVGRDLKEAINLLTICGLGQGHLFLHKFSQLSDGQKFRVMLAMLLDRKKSSNIYIDEFGSKLDESTALAIACTLKKYIRKNELTVFMCCNNLSIAKKMQPDVLIKLDNDSGYEIDTSLNIEEISEYEVEIVKGTIEDYQYFKKYHYLSEDGRIDGAKVFIAKKGNERLGIILLISALSEKRVVLHPFFKTINENIITGHRMVIRPEFMGCGIGKQIVNSMNDYTKYPIFEIRSTLFYYAPIPLSWGMTEFEYEYFKNRPYHNELETYIKSLGFESHKLVIKDYAYDLIKKASSKKLCSLLKKVADERHSYQLIYYIKLLEKKDIHCPYDINDLCKILVSIDREPNSIVEIWNELKKFSESKYRAFYYIK